MQLVCLVWIHWNEHYNTWIDRIPRNVLKGLRRMANLCGVMGIYINCSNTKINVVSKLSVIEQTEFNYIYEEDCFIDLFGRKDTEGSDN